MSKPKVLVADDEENVRLDLRLRLAREGFEVVTVETASAALEALQSDTPDVVLCDLRGTSDHDAPLLTATNLRIALDNAAARLRMRVPLVLASGLDPYVLDGIAATLVHTHALPKPFSRNALRALVARVTGVT